MTVRDDVNFNLSNSEFKKKVANMNEDSEELWNIIEAHFQDVVAANVADIKKVEELKNILYKVESIDLFNDGLARRILEQQIKYTPRGYDDELKRIAEKVSFHSNKGYRPAQLNNMDCLSLINAAYVKLNNKEDFHYKEHIDVYNMKMRNQKIADKKDARKKNYTEANKRLEEINKALQTDISAEKKFALIDEAIELSAEKAFGRKEANKKKVAYCNQAIEICVYGYPCYEDKKIYYEGEKFRYLKNAKNAQKYSRANRKKMMFTKNTSQYF